MLTSCHWQVDVDNTWDLLTPPPRSSARTVSAPAAGNFFFFFSSSSCCFFFFFFAAAAGSCSCISLVISPQSFPSPLQTLSSQQPPSEISLLSSSSSPSSSSSSSWSHAEVKSRVSGRRDKFGTALLRGSGGNHCSCVLWLWNPTPAPTPPLSFYGGASPSHKAQKRKSGRCPRSPPDVLPALLEGCEATGGHSNVRFTALYLCLSSSQLLWASLKRCTNPPSGSVWCLTLQVRLNSAVSPESVPLFIR